MSWKRHFTPVKTSANTTGSYSPFSFSKGNGLGPAASNYSSHLPDVYVGSPNRVERYGQYNTMDSDSEVNAALDILAEFCSQKILKTILRLLLSFLKKLLIQKLKFLENI